jgi:Dyp-type peroxidase family
MAGPVLSKSLAGSSELCMIMPIRAGFTPGLATRTYKSRLRSFAKLFSDLRVLTRESRLEKPFSDIVERLQTIHGVTISILDDELLLAVHFDRPWEPYIRLVWGQLGDIFDLILCNCEGYREQHRTELGFEAFAGWIRKYQVETNTFYMAASRTVSDVIYLEQLERVARGDSVSAAALATLALQSPEETAAQVRAPLSGSSYVEYIKTGVQAVSAFHALTELYPKTSADHDFLIRTARAVLPEAEFPRRRDWNTNGTQALKILGAVFSTELNWFEDWQETPVAPIRDPEAAAPPASDAVQGGILAPLSANVGVVALLTICDAAGARAFLQTLSPQLSWGGQQDQGVYQNLAFTPEGLRRIGLAPDQVDRFPPAFVQGMAARAGLIGDVRFNHPDRWTLPERNWPDSEDAAALQRVNLESVDLVLQLRRQADPAERSSELDQRLQEVLAALERQASGAVRVLHVQPTYALGAPGAPQEHFGFRDGISNPAVADAGDAADDPELIAPGDVFLGRRNSRDDTVGPQWQEPLFKDGSFLVLRKLAQDVVALDDALARAAEAPAQEPRSAAQLGALLMGRQQDGTPLVSHAGPNAFDFQDDPDGAQCPMFSHVRRINPRDQGSTVPRLVRRGMSWGPAYSPETANQRRGLLFQGYNASIPEQFEVLQRWLSGGNRTAPYSDLSDPITGVPQPGQPRRYRLANGDPVDLGEQPFVLLDWGLYLFVPSRAGLAEILSAPSVPERDWAGEGQALIDSLQSLEARDPAAAKDQWKRLLEEKDALDHRQDRALWQAVRDRHAGVLRTPFGVLVGEAGLVAQVLAKPTHFSVARYARRLAHCVGENYLGMDPPEHDRRANAANMVFYGISEADAFAVAYQAGSGLLTGLSQVSGQATIPLPKYADLLLAEVAKHWFGVPDGETMLELFARLSGNDRTAAGAAAFVMAGGQPSSGETTVHCPYHVISSSRYVFQPQPTRQVDERAEHDGQRLRAGVENYVEALVAEPQALARKPVLHAVYRVLQRDGLEDDFAGVLLGALLGYMPTVQGNFFFSVREWIRGRELWRVQNSYLAARAQGLEPLASAIDGVRPQLVQTIASRPIPAMIHRQAEQDTVLGGKAVRKNDVVVLGLSSATAQSGFADMSAAFGGNYGDVPKPTHACPGQKLGVGTLLGMIAALFDLNGALRRAPADGAVLFDPPI